MKGSDFNYLVSVFLIVSVILTGLTGLIAAELELHRFVPHKYFAFATLFLVSVHLYFNLPKLLRYLKSHWLRRMKNRGFNNDPDN